MEAHISDLRRLVKLTTNRDTLRVLSDAISKARRRARDDARQERRAARYQARHQRRQMSVNLRRLLPNTKWAKLNDLRVETQTARSVADGVGTQDTREGYLHTHWQGQPQQPNVSSTVV